MTPEARIKEVELRLTKKIDGLQKEVTELKDILNVHENWNSEIRKMYGKRVEIQSHSGTTYTGVLIWTDRYSICIDCDARERRLTLSKGGVLSICLA